MCLFVGIALLCQKQPPRCHPSTTQLLLLNGPPQRPQDCLRRLRELIPPGSTRWPWLDKVRSIQQAHRDRAYIVKEPDEESTPPRTSAEGTKATGSKPSPGTPQFAEASFTDTLRHEPKALRSWICANLFSSTYSGNLRLATVLARLFPHARGCSLGVRKSSKQFEGEYQWELS